MPRTSGLAVDLLVNEVHNLGLALPFSEPVAHFQPAARGSLRRRRHSAAARPQPTDWAEVFEGQEPVVVRAAPEATRLQALSWDVGGLEEQLPEVRVHASSQQTVQMMSTVQPLGGDALLPPLSLIHI